MSISDIITLSGHFPYIPPGREAFVTAQNNNDNFGSRGLNVRVHSNGTPVAVKSKRIIFIGLLVLLVTVNVMLGLFSSISGGCFQVLNLKISDEYITIFHGDDYQLSATTLTTGEGNIEFRWESDNPELVQVDETGKITGLEVGKAAVTVTEQSTGHQAVCNVTVMALAEMTVERTEYTLGVGEQDTISAFSGNGREVEYVSSDPSVATVDENGGLTAVSPGDVTITISGFGCEKIPCTVSVKKAPSAITFDTSLKMCAGESRLITASVAEDEHCSGFTLSVDSGIVEIAEDGTLTALSSGEATITATAYNGVTGKGTITVREAPVSISAKLEDKTLYTGNTTQMKPKENTGFCQQFIYSTSDPAVATVDKDGVVTATGKGTASIYCETYNGVKTSCKVDVTIVDYTTPYTSSRVARNCQELVTKYPDLLKMETIGKSTHGTDIILLKMGTGEKKALITGGIHSREDITVNFVMRCIEEYAEGFTKNGRYGTYNLGRMLTEWTLYFVPAMNPDGIDIANDGLLPLYKNGQPLSEVELFDFKNTSTGVNLNRNFPFEW